MHGAPQAASKKLIGKPGSEPTPTAGSAPTSSAAQAPSASGASSAPSDPSVFGGTATPEVAERHRFPVVPFVFLGVGFYRAWIEIAFVGSFVSFPAIPFGARECFDGVGAIVMLICVLLARRIGPFYRHPSIFVLCGACMTLATVALFATMIVPSLGYTATWLAAIVGGVGMGLVILIWSEVFGCLSPLRVTLYYTASIALGAVIVYVFMGLRLPWLACLTALLPAVSLVLARRSMNRIPAEKRPQPNLVNFKPPWKIFLLMALYGFAYGILETRVYTDSFGPHSSPGVLVVALVIFLSVGFRREKFDFNSIVRIALPLTVAALWLVPMWGAGATLLSGPCAIGGYTAATVLIMALCSNMCYRHGVSAIWLFGIERSLRLAFMFLGRTVANMGEHGSLGAADGGLLISGLSMIAVIMATVLLLSQKNVDGQWGLSFLNGSGKSRADKHAQQVDNRCTALAAEYHLTARELEILKLLARHKTVGMIERELVIANGTAKAHVRHIYQKLNIHSREELFNLLDPHQLDPLEEQE